MIENSFLIAQMIGLCAMFISIASWQVKNPKLIVFLNFPSCSLWGLQYIFLNAPMGVITCFSTALKDGSLYFLPKKYGQIVIVTFLIITLGLLVANMRAWYDLLPIIALVIYNAALYVGHDNRPVMARSIIITKLCWIAYCSIVGAYVGALCAFLVLISSIIGMARHESWQLKACYRSFGPSLLRSLFTFPSWRTYP